MTRIFTITTFIFILLFGFFGYAHADSETLYKPVLYDQKITIDHELITAYVPPIVENSNPTFQGYTTPDTKITVRLEPTGWTGSTLSDASGQWTLQVDKKLDFGDYKMFIAFTDRSGYTSPEIEVNSFAVSPKSLYKQILATPLLNLDFIKLALVVFGLLIIGVVIYLKLNSRYSKDLS